MWNTLNISLLSFLNSCQTESDKYGFREQISQKIFPKKHDNINKTQVPAHYFCARP